MLFSSIARIATSIAFSVIAGDISDIFTTVFCGADIRVKVKDSGRVCLQAGRGGGSRGECSQVTPQTMAVTIIAGEASARRVPKS